MKKKIQIKTKSKDYKIIIENNCIEKHLKSMLISNSKTFIIVDNKISKKITSIIKNNKNVFLIKVKGSELLKTIDFYWKITSILLQKNIDRSATLIAIGGGTVGDLCGFIASTVLRGIKFVLIPSTLLAQVDSSIGGKNGINSKFGKNLVGTFYQPDLVIIDPSILKSLPLRQIKSGYVEILKHALINDKVFFQWLKKNIHYLFMMRNSTLIYAITKSINIKAKYVMRDEKENLINSSSRAMLNFGHTFGHALEALNKYNSSLTHGEAVSIGMTVAAKISYKLKNIRKDELDDIIAHLKAAGLPYYSDKIKNDRLYKIIATDKKNVNNKVNLILLKRIGKAYYQRNLNFSKLKKLIN